MVTSLSLATCRKSAVASMQKAQVKYKKCYDQLRKLVNNASCLNPSLTETGVTAMKVYKPEERSISVHASRVSRCPSGFPAGSYGERSGLDAPLVGLMNSDEDQVQDTNDLNDLAEDLSTPDDLNRDNQDRDDQVNPIQQCKMILMPRNSKLIWHWTYLYL